MCLFYRACLTLDVGVFCSGRVLSCSTVIAENRDDVNGGLLPCEKMQRGRNVYGRGVGGWVDKKQPATAASFFFVFC